MEGEAFGHNTRVRVDNEIEVGISADIESQGTELTPRDGQITTAATTTLITAGAGKVLLLKRAAFSVDSDQTNANGTFHFIIVDADDNSRKFGGVWNPKTGAIYGGNVSPDYLQSGTAKTIKIVTPTGFADKLDWEVLYQEIDA
jgi:hypothetical protein